MLNYKQRKLLKLISKHHKYFYSDSESSAISYLASLGYTEKFTEGGDRWGGGAKAYCRITEFGRAYLFNFRRKSITQIVAYLITTGIALAGLINSVIARLGY